MKNSSACLVAVVLVAGLVLIGCDSSDSGPDMDAMVSQMDQSKRAAAEAAAQAEAEKAKAAEEAARAAEAAAAAQAAAQAAAPAEPQDETTITITVKNPGGLLRGATGGQTTAGGATVGQGGSYADAIIGARRHITTRMDDLAWTQAVQHYWATNGRYPKSHEEFMRDVIDAQGIPLPELEQGQEYLYAPPGSELSEDQFGTLYIVTPAPPEQAPPEQAPSEQPASDEPPPPAE